LAACYLAGLLTMFVLRAPAWLASTAPGSVGGWAAREDAKVDNGFQPTSARPLVRPEDDGVIPGSRSAQSAITKLTPYDRLRRAGDRQLQYQNDIAAAARTYRRALESATAAQRSVSPDQDTWLLMAMKNDQSDKLMEDLQ